jgi:hypothetical protein
MKGKNKKIFFMMFSFVKSIKKVCVKENVFKEKIYWLNDEKKNWRLVHNNNFSSPSYLYLLTFSEKVRQWECKTAVQSVYFARSSPKNFFFSSSLVRIH